MPQYQTGYPSVNNRLLEEKIPIGWPWRFLTAMVVIFVAALISFLGLKFGYEPYLSNNLQAAKNQATTLGGELASEENQQNFLGFYSKINNVQSLLNNHVSAAAGLDFVESLTEPAVTYTSLKISVPQDEIDLSGTADSYATLASELQAFQNDAEVSQAVLGGSQASAGVVQFNLKLLVKPAVFKYQSGGSTAAASGQ